MACTCTPGYSVDILETFDGGVIGTDNGTTVIWTDGGNVPWQASSAGLLTGDYYESGDIPNSQTSNLTLDVLVDTGGGDLTFDWATDSEVNFDFLDVLVNGVLELRESGGANIGSFGPFALPAGSNTIDFIYDKDASVSSFSDLAAIDNVGVTNVVPEPATGLVALGLLALFAIRRR
jgi:hypothetical protein